MRGIVRAYDSYDVDEASAASALFCKGESKTDQSQKTEADINTIVKRFGITGQVPVSLKQAVEGEFVEVFDLQKSLNAVNEARLAFDSLPLVVRKRFGYDPLEFAEFCLNKDNAQELHNLGLTTERVPDKIPEVKIANVGDLLKEKDNEHSVREGARSGKASSGQAGGKPDGSS